MAMTTAPVRYTPDVEERPHDEAETIAELKNQFRKIQDITAEDYGHGVRGVHAKGHGLLRGTLIVHDDLPLELTQGLFAQGGRHAAILRISTNPGDILDDAVRVPRGAALKVLDVDGERLAGSDHDNTQDFLMANAPAFAAADPKAFLGSLKMLARTTDRAEWAKKALSAVMRSGEAVLEAFGTESATLKSLGGAAQTHPLGETYYSQTPFRFGDFIAKFALVPVSPGLTELAGTTVSTSGRPDALREEVNETMVERGGTWELRVQLATDLESMPIEDASVRWDEDASPYRTVATLEFPAQQAWVDGTSDHAEDILSFSPWHGLAAHQPLGGVNRARKAAYEFSAGHRGRANGCPVREPRRLEDVPR